MNCRYFACIDCQKYIEAGCRWAYWLLEHQGLVQLDTTISVEKILQFKDYWNPPIEESSEWLVKKVLPAVQSFLVEHQQHNLLYSEEDSFAIEDSIYSNFEEIQISS